jgi:hypothetical protein
MKPRLVNVRLDAARLRKIRALRDRGITLSDVVREAIDTEYEAIARPPTAASAAGALDRILERYPDPPDLPARTYDVHDRRAARAAITRTLKRRSR